MNRLKEKLTEKLKNKSINSKLKTSHGIIVVLSVIIAVVLLVGMTVIAGKVKKIFVGPMTNVSDIADIKYGLTDLQSEINSYIIAGNAGAGSDYNGFSSNMEADVKLVTEAVQSLDETIDNSEGKDVLERLKSKINEGEKIRPQLMTLLKNKDLNNAYTYNKNTYKPVVNDIKELSLELESIINASGKSYYKSSMISSYVLIGIGVVLLIIAVAASVMLTGIITDMLTAPIKELDDAAAHMYNGDLGAADNITYESEDELGELAEALRGTMNVLYSYVDEISATLREIAKGDLTKPSENITDFRGDFASIKESFVYILKNFNITLTNIQNTSGLVEAGAADIASAAVELSTGTTDQASSIEELTATVETVANLAETSAKKTQEAYESIEKAARDAKSEQVRMQELTEEMANITAISKEIENITATIEDIASQTSLLALNASIEAARAGEAGKGFAVVVDEIGKLATDSSNSAVNTRELIGKTMEEIGKGNDITASVAEVFGKIIGQMHEFAEVARTTNEASKGQADALAQIEAGIEQISGVTQNTAAAAQESNAISTQLSEKADELDELVRRFKLYSAVEKK